MFKIIIFNKTTKGIGYDCLEGLGADGSVGLRGRGAKPYTSFDTPSSCTS